MVDSGIASEAWGVEWNIGSGRGFAHYPTKDEADSAAERIRRSPAVDVMARDVFVRVYPYSNPEPPQEGE